MDATIVCRSTFMNIYSSIEEGLLNIFPDFDPARLQCMKSFLEMRHREKESEKDSESETESSEASHPSSPKGVSKQIEEQPLLPLDQPPLQAPLPQDDAAPQDHALE